MTRLKIVFALFAILHFQFCLLLPAFAGAGKDVDLDIQNAHAAFAKIEKPYAIALRKSIEARWDALHLVDGRSTEIEFIILKTGTPANFLAPSQYPELEAVAMETVANGSPYPELPHGIDFLQIRAKFRTNRPPLIKDKQAFVNGVTQAMFAAALLALTGYAVYQLGKMSNNQRTGYGYTNPDWQWVNYPRVNADGVWVSGYWRSRANGTILDNFSTVGNVNPVTGQPGYVNPY